jgi:hypothetical protein
MSTATAERTLAEARAEVARLEAIDADIGLGEKGRDNLDNARKAFTALDRQERRFDGQAKQELANALSHHEAQLQATYVALQEYVAGKQHLEQARRNAAAAERVARQRGVLTATHGDAERKFFDRYEWREFHNVVKETLGSKVL